MESKPRKILIIDDDPGFLEALRMTLLSRSCEALVASSLEQAQKIPSLEPDLVVLGTLAPSGQAFAFHKWLKKHPRYKEVPLIVVDAEPHEKQHKGWRRHEGLQMEAEDYVSKPIEPTSLVLRILKILEEETHKITVLVVDDHALVRDGISAVLGLQEDMILVGEAVNGREAIEKTIRLLPHVVLMDIVMPIMNGLEAARQISKECPLSKVLMLTQYDEEENMQAARNAGAYGFIPKRAASSDLMNGIKSVYEGRHFPSSFLRMEA
jgi:DNA-binding NarL/FixJ family response regulator